MKTASDVVDFLHQMAAALRVFGRTQEDHRASFDLDRAAHLAHASIEERPSFYPDRDWLDYLNQWRAIHQKEKP